VCGASPQHHSHGKEYLYTTWRVRAAFSSDAVSVCCIAGTFARCRRFSPFVEKPAERLIGNPPLEPAGQRRMRAEFDPFQPPGTQQDAGGLLMHLQDSRDIMNGREAERHRLTPSQIPLPSGRGLT